MHKWYNICLCYIYLFLRLAPSLRKEYDYALYMLYDLIYKQIIYKLFTDDLYINLCCSSFKKRSRY